MQPALAEAARLLCMRADSFYAFADSTAVLHDGVQRPCAAMRQGDIGDKVKERWHMVCAVALAMSRDAIASPPEVLAQVARVRTC